MSTPPPPPGGPVGPGGFQPPPGYQQPGHQQPGYQQPGYQQPGYPPQGYQPYGQPVAQPGNSGMAIASLVCSLVGAFFCGLPSVLGVIFGFVGLSQTKDNARPGRGLAIAGIVIGLIVILFWVGLFVVAANDEDGCIHFGTGPNTCD